MTKWLEQASQWYELYCHDLKVMSLNPGRVELGVRGMVLLSYVALEPKIPLYEIPYNPAVCLFRQFYGVVNL